MDTTVRDYPLGDLRVSDGDRDRALAELGDAFEAGRITASEFDQRSGQVLCARTGKELTDLLADLPLDRAPATGATGLQRAHRVLATWIAIGVSAATAATLAAVAAANALGSNGSGSSNGLDPQQRVDLARQILAREGLQLPRGFRVPAAPGFDWAGTVTPAAFAVLLVVLITVLYLTRPRRPRTGARAHR
jgi:hypothetical protein